MTKHFGPAHLKRDVPGLEAFAFAGEAPPRTGVIYGTNYCSHIVAPVVENLLMAFRVASFQSWPAKCLVRRSSILPSETQAFRRLHPPKTWTFQIYFV